MSIGVKVLKQTASSIQLHAAKLQCWCEAENKIIPSQIVLPNSTQTEVESREACFAPVITVIKNTFHLSCYKFIYILHDLCRL